MITKKRLEELANQGATIYIISSSGIIERKLKNKTFDFGLLSILVCNLGIPYEIWNYIDLFETQEEAELFLGEKK